MEFWILLVLWELIYKVGFCGWKTVFGVSFEKNYLIGIWENTLYIVVFKTPTTIYSMFWAIRENLHFPGLCSRIRP